MMVGACQETRCSLLCGQTSQIVPHVKVWGFFLPIFNFLSERVACKTTGLGVQIPTRAIIVLTCGTSPRYPTVWSLDAVVDFLNLFCELAFAMEEPHQLQILGRSPGKNM